MSSASVVWSVALPTAHHVRAAVARFHSRARNSPTTAAMLVRRDGGRDGVEECRRRRWKTSRPCSLSQALLLQRPCGAHRRSCRGSWINRSMGVRGLLEQALKIETPPRLLPVNYSPPRSCGALPPSFRQGALANDQISPTPRHKRLREFFSCSSFCWFDCNSFNFTSDVKAVTDRS